MRVKTKNLSTKITQQSTPKNKTNKKKKKKNKKKKKKKREGEQKI